MPASVDFGVQMVRVVGFAVLALAALVVMVAMGPSVEDVDTSTFDRLVDQALSDAEANEARTQGAPQQQVVNGWTNRDLLTAISRQMSAEIEATQPYFWRSACPSPAAADGLGDLLARCDPSSGRNPFGPQDEHGFRLRGWQLL